MAKNIVNEMMSQMICYGGMAATRAEVYKDALKICRTRTDTEGQARRGADQFAFGDAAVTLTSDQAAALPRFNPKTGMPVGCEICPS